MDSSPSRYNSPTGFNIRVVLSPSSTFTSRRACCRLDAGPVAMSAKYTPIAGYPDGVYNFGPRYDDTSTRASSRSLDAPAPRLGLAIRPATDALVRWLHERDAGRTRARAPRVAPDAIPSTRGPTLSPSPTRSLPPQAETRRRVVLVLPRSDSRHRGGRSHRVRRTGRVSLRGGRQAGRRVLRAAVPLLRRPRRQRREVRSCERPANQHTRGQRRARTRSRRRSSRSEV